MKITGGEWAWQFLKCNPAYVEDWWRWAVPAPEEPAPFPLGAQTEADLRAAEWGLFAWVDPSADDGAAPAFWIEAPTFEAEPSPEGAVLLELLAMPEARLDGLRLADGSVIVKVDQGGTSAHLRVADGGGFDPEGRFVVHIQMPAAWNLRSQLRRTASLWPIGAPAKQKKGGTSTAGNSSLRSRGSSPARTRRKSRLTCSAQVMWIPRMQGPGGMRMASSECSCVGASKRPII